MTVFPKVFGGVFRVVPNYLLEKVDALLDAQLARVPDAAKDREFLKQQIIDHIDATGDIPEFSIVPRDPADIEADLAAEQL